LPPGPHRARNYSPTFDSKFILRCRFEQESVLPGSLNEERRAVSGDRKFHGSFQARINSDYLSRTSGLRLKITRAFGDNGEHFLRHSPELTQVCSPRVTRPLTILKAIWRAPNSAGATRSEKRNGSPCGPLFLSAKGSILASAEEHFTLCFRIHLPVSKIRIFGEVMDAVTMREHLRDSNSLGVRDLRERFVERVGDARRQADCECYG
jgi:hypothetical protein